LTELLDYPEILNACYVALTMSYEIGDLTSIVYVVLYLNFNLYAQPTLFDSLINIFSNMLFFERCLLLSSIQIHSTSI